LDNAPLGESPGAGASAGCKGKQCVYLLAFCKYKGSLLNLLIASEIYFPVMKPPKQRSTCALSSSLDILGDKWTLLILRDILFIGKSSYGEFAQSEEKMATNILADRLALLECQGIVTKTVAADKKSKFTYRLTEKGLALAPLLAEFILWGHQHCDNVADTALMLELRQDQAGTIRKYQELARAAALLPATL
jgi:DNA-binding HxlR family transcriptional regulator